MKAKQIDTGIVGRGSDIIYANGKYYLVSYDEPKICVSEDLEEWEEYPLNPNYIIPRHIVYGKGQFIVVGQQPSNKTWIYRSTDGINWTPIQLPTPEDLSFGLDGESVRFVNNKFIIVSGGWITTWRRGDTVTKREETIVFFESSDGINWSMKSFVHDRGINYEYKTIQPLDIAYHNGKYIYVGYSGSIFTSNNLVDWKKQESGFDHTELRRIAYGKGQFIAIGDLGIIMTSPDGYTWKMLDSFCDSYLTDVRYANGMYFICGYNGTILQSLDGLMWNDISSNHSGVRYGLAYNNEDNIMVITANTFKISHTIPLYALSLSREIIADDEDSSIFFFNKELELLGVVDSFISLRWRRKYFEAGEFEIVLPVNEYITAFIDTDVLVMRNNYTEAGIIETIEYNDNGTDEEMIISGRFLSSLLSRRIVKNKINYSGNVIEGMNTIVDSMTPLTTRWETEQVSMISPHIDFQVTYKNIYEYLCKLSEYSNIGFRIVPNVAAKVYMFEVWKGKDRTVNQNENEIYTFSDDNFNIEQGKLIISEKTKANYVLVGGVGEDNNRILVEVDNGSSGFDRYEIFSDQKSLSNKDISDDAYRSKLHSIGEGKLSDGIFQLEVTAQIQQDYKTKWDLGDVVNIKKDKWGVLATYRIIEIEETIEDGKKTIYPTFGSPLSSAWEDE